MSVDIKTLIEKAKGFTILYVEDELDVRLIITKTLNMIFKNVITAENGKVGLELFKKHSPDIIITDIRMPQMDGLEMSREIKKLSPHTPIIITTAFNENNYFIKSIDIGIDKYIIKPVVNGPLLSTIYDITEKLRNERELKEFKRKEIEERMYRVSQSVISSIVNSLPNPVITYQNGKILYVNNAFLELLNAKTIDSLNSGETFTLNKIIENRKGFLDKIEHYSEDNTLLNRISIKHKYGHQVFLLNKKVFTIEDEKTQVELFSLNNISLQEYQKNKLKTYTEMLEEFIFQSRYTKTVREPKTKDSKKNEHIASQLKQDEPHKLNIDTEQMVNLHKTHIVKTSANAYIAELDVETLQDMQELHELENEIEDLLSEYSGSKEIKEFYIKTSQKLQSYSQTIQILIEFDDLAFAIHSFSELLLKEYQSIDEKMHKKLTIFIKNFLDDLIAWRQTIFVTQSTIDIHYLDSSLLSAILQIEVSLTPGVNEIEDEENDDLVLF